MAADRAEARSRSPPSRPKLARLAGQKALVTGGGSGIGRAIAVLFACEGADVIVCGRREDCLKETVARATAAAAAGKVSFMLCDQSVADVAEKTVKAARDKLGSIDILVNNAGVNIPNRALKDLALSDWHNLINVNLNGAYHMVHSVLPLMREKKRGTIINISSISGRRSLALSGAAYCSSKFGMNALGDMINAEEGKNGIRCTNICPGECETEILEKRPVKPDAAHRAKMIQPEDVAEMALSVAALPQRAFVPLLTITGLSTLAEAL
eukprot:TRINITY_DN83578_c0_g1_i1.p1 TRINITY_DN83578_c0_g1~~TRINITY_DN83578_c0_g1_i1.p1  ORF type:complete len:285 (+),score=69.02 TRINITY_DN83578_c0_g1_i1:53-856(+)